jgi:hypothetical protein
LRRTSSRFSYKGGSVMFTILDFIKPNKDCQLCDHHNDYTCFDCEEIQVKNKYPNSYLNNEGLWNLETDYIPMV